MQEVFLQRDPRLNLISFKPFPSNLSGIVELPLFLFFFLAKWSTKPPDKLSKATETATPQLTDSLGSKMPSFSQPRSAKRLLPLGMIKQSDVFTARITGTNTLLFMRLTQDIEQEPLFRSVLRY